MPTVLDGTPVVNASQRGDGSSPSGRRLRVCHVSLGLSTGGLERLLVDFARFHDRSAIEMSFVALHEAGRPAQEIEAAGCQVQALHSQQLGRLARLHRLARLFREQQYDVVHTHNAFPHIYGTLAARWAGVPVVVHTRHGQRFGHGWWSRLQFRTISRAVDRIVAVSDDAARLCQSADGLPAHKVQRIWNGIDLSRFRYHGPAQKPIAISVARLSPEKDFPTLVRAVPRILQAVPHFELRIVGGGAERERIEDTIRELDLADHVQCLGERSDVPELLAEAAFFVSSSVTEGVSLTLLEAMAVGLPIVATAVGGNPEVVSDGRTGVLVPPRDPEALADAIIRLCELPEMWFALGQAGRHRVEDHFDVRRMVRDYEALYANLLAARQPHRNRTASAPQ